MANKKITDLVALTSADSTDVLEVVDVSANSNKKVTVAGLAGGFAGLITNAMLSAAAGEPGAAWSSWTPTWTNVTGGTLNYAKYKQVGKTVHFRIKYTMAGAGVSGPIIFSAPANLHADYALETPVNGSANFLDSGSQLYPAQLLANSTSAFLLRPVGAAATYDTGAANASSTVPMTWATGDEIKASGSYEAA